MSTQVYNMGMSRYYDLVCNENKDLVNDFIKYCSSCNRSPKTIHHYEELLKIFFSWNYSENEDKLFITLRKRDFIYFISYLREKHSSFSRIKNLISGLSSFSNMIEQLYDVEYPSFKNQLKGLDTGVKQPIREKTVLNHDIVINMLDTLVNKKKYQAACYLAMACASGARRAELIQFKVEWFTDDNVVFNNSMYKTDTIRTKGHGVRGKELQKYAIKDLVDPYLKLWLIQRKEFGIKSEYLFVNKCGDQATIDTANSFCETITKACKIKFYSHAARHFFCTYLKTLDYPDEIIRMIIGWESTDLIRTYNDTSDEDSLNRYFKRIDTKCHFFSVLNKENNLCNVS